MRPVLAGIVILVFLCFTGESRGAGVDLEVILASDVSGDGTNNSGRPVTEARDQAIAGGVTINGLAIINDKPNLGYSAHTQPPGGLPLYYRQNVIGGPNAFLLVVEDFNSFADAMANKLAKEIDVAGSAAEKQVSLLHPGELP